MALGSTQARVAPSRIITEFHRQHYSLGSLYGIQVRTVPIPFTPRMAVLGSAQVRNEENFE